MYSTSDPTQNEPSGSPRNPLPIIITVLAVIMVCLLIAIAIVFAMKHRKSPTPDKGMLPFTAPIQMSLSSGAGAWGTGIILNPDGTFSGSYHDSDMGISGEGYKATIWVSSFEGKFTNITKEDDNTYSMTLEYYNTEKPVNEEWIKDEVRYVSAEPVGIAEGKTFKLYLPGSPVDRLPEEYVSWIFDLDKKTALPGFGLYNVEGNCGFSGY